MLTVATNMQGQHELWELLHNFQNLETNGAPAVPALIHWAGDPDYWVRAGVVNALGGIGQRPDLAVPTLLTALHDSNSMVRRDAAEALGTFANDSEAVLPQLIKTLNDSDLEARGGALSGLGASEINLRPLFPSLFRIYLTTTRSSHARQPMRCVTLAVRSVSNSCCRPATLPTSATSSTKSSKKPVANNRNRERLFGAN
ncbi:MAG: domain containing protein [Pedosphaera sp.]|nr:domain containing protein [Pedosphaera sp.]